MPASALSSILDSSTSNLGAVLAAGLPPVLVRPLFSQPNSPTLFSLAGILPTSVVFSYWRRTITPHPCVCFEELLIAQSKTQMWMVLVVCQYPSADYSWNGEGVAAGTAALQPPVLGRRGEKRLDLADQVRGVDHDQAGLFFLTRANETTFFPRALCRFCASMMIARRS